MTKHDFVKLARFSFLAADFLKLKYPPIILLVAIDELHTGVEYYLFNESKMLGIVLHEFLKVGGGEVNGIFYRESVSVDLSVAA
jgi:hypothetical protein